jgi:hypothetical protein
MATSKIQVTLDDRLIALLGDDRSGNVRDAIIQLFNVDRTTLTPNITKFAGGAKPIPSSFEYPAQIGTVRPAPKQSAPKQPIPDWVDIDLDVDFGISDERVAIDAEQWVVLRKEFFNNDPDMTDAEADRSMNERYRHA